MAPLEVQEAMATLYFASLGITATRLSTLLMHKYGVERGHDCIRNRIQNHKKNAYVFDGETGQWLLENVGEYLAAQQFQGRSTDHVEFEAVIKFREEYEYLAWDSRLANQRVEDLRTGINAVSIAYYHAWSLQQQAKHKQARDLLCT